RLCVSQVRTSRISGSAIRSGVAAGCGQGQAPEIVDPTPLMSGAGLGARQTAMGEVQQRAALPLDQIDLDQARPRWDVVPPLPTEAVGEAVDRDHFRKT